MRSTVHSKKQLIGLCKIMINVKKNDYKQQDLVFTVQIIKIIHTSYPHIISKHPTHISYQHIISTHHIIYPITSPSYPHIIFKHHIQTSYPHIISIHHINTSHHTPSHIPSHPHHIISKHYISSYPHIRKIRLGDRRHCPPAGRGYLRSRSASAPTSPLVDK